MGRVSTAIFFFCLLFISSVNSFYLPGVAPRDFQRGDPLQIKVNKLSSTKTQLPYDYYYLKYCKPQKIKNSAENLGEVLRGDRIENSIYTFHMREEQPCKVACRVKLNAEAAKNFKEKIDDEYRVNMILDNLPVAVLRQRRDGSQSTTYEHGFRVGFKGNYAGSKEEKYFINNHLSFRVMYHKDIETDSARIVGFEVTPNSINHQYKEWDEKNPQLATCNQNTKNIIQGSTVPQEVDTDKEVVFTYDVSYKESDIKWASRWDTYLLMNDDQIHWFSIINSLMIVLFLSGMVAMIMMRTLYRDIANYNQLETQDEAQEETGWKLVHGDVFRAPINSGLLCVYVGTGVQVFAMTLVTMIFALLGFLSPSNRGGLMTAMVLLWVFMGLFAGYSSARLYKMLKGTEWKRNTLKTAFMFPGILFSIFFVLNALIWGEKSSGAVPFGTMIALVCLWFGISVPLVFVGSYLGFKKPAIEDPVKTNKIPRQVPEQAWYMTPIFSILIGGILPFGAVFIELFFILTSIWLNQLWQQVFPVGTEWDQLDLVYQYKWNFSNLESAFEQGGELYGKNVYLFGCTEPQLVFLNGQGKVTVIPVVVAVESPFPPSDKIGVNSVQREVEEILPMKQMKMDWVPYIPLENRDSQVERLKSQIFILSCTQRRAGLKQMKLDRLKKFEYCLPYFYQPFKEDELEQSTIVPILFPAEPKPVFTEFDWEFDEVEEFTDKLIEEEELSTEQKEAFKNFLKEKVREAKKANREAREARKKAIEEMSEETKAAFENMKFYKFYPVPSPDTPDVSDVKSPFINRYYGKAHKVL